MKKHIFTSLRLTILCIAISFTALASHNRSGEILYKRIAPYSQVVNNVTVPVYTYSITVKKYTNDGSGIADRCFDTIFFGDGSKAAVARSNGPSGTCCPGSTGCGQLLFNTSSYKLKLNIYTTTHVYPGIGTYVVFSSDPNRSSGIDNIPNSINQPFYIESKIIITATTDENSSPVLTNPPLDFGILGACYFHNPAAFDPDGDSLSYEMIPCMVGGQAIPGYSFPSAGTNGTFGLDATTGLVTWCSPQLQGVFQIAFFVKEWRRNCSTGLYNLIGYVERDMEITVVTNNNPLTFNSNGSADTCVETGALVLKTIKSAIAGATAQNVTLFGFTNDASTLPSASLAPTSSTSILYSGYNWQTNCSQIRYMPHTVYLKYEVNNTPFFQSFYRQFNVKVVPPAPVITSVVKDTGKVTLTWNAANCSANLSGYKIYRKIGNNTWSHGPCETGVPASSGFVQIGFTTLTSYVDQFIWPTPNGSTGNYIVTALMNDCTESYATATTSISLLVGISENTNGLKNVQIYPNPFNNYFIIILGAQIQNLNVSLYDVGGRLIYEKFDKESGSVFVIPTKEMAPGVYLLRLKSDQGIYYKKLIKE